MNSTTKYPALLLLAVILLPSCENDEINADPALAAALKTHRVITLDGRQNDTAYLYGAYHDRGAMVVKYVNGSTTCDDVVLVSDISGTVNTNLPGTYFLKYNADDTTGNPLPVVTRTVHVVENTAGFLNGNYNVVCTCAVMIAGVPGQTLTTENYTATISTGSANGKFDLTLLKIGDEYVLPFASLRDKVMDVGYRDRDFVDGSCSGTLDPSKNSFTIESTYYRSYPKITYLCKNIYTRQLILNQESTAIK